MNKQFKNGNAYLVIALIMMAILFYSSSQTYEQQTTIPLLEKMLKNEPFKNSLSNVSFTYAGSLVSIETSGYFKFVEFFIRKLAHFGTYFVLGGSLFLGINPRMQHLGISFGVAWLSATGYAALDEFHQMMTGGRSPLFEDVILDSSGAIFACTILVIYYLLAHRKKGAKKRS
ncbi:VanZ family protein [Vagococcus fluvialis]|uniref:VanZ family protein n=1 Tax=Vagococcus fluvialis TaxID=2738 RepID=A0A7X6D6C5_9ENTE|nr:VanZ family protein [Vagococcus fluvialis]MBO0442593.1 VanZ family protein [Vagococcus fluvialis]NKC66592.1 VanZ family protein [Vagococcus fluvialis]